MPELMFGFSLVPTLDMVGHRELALAAEGEGLDWIGIQDHPYVADYLDTLVLAGALLERTSRIAVFPDVANLPLRPPAILAKTAAALDLLSGGRFELALGGGGYWNAISRMGVLRRTSAQANAALAEAIALIRALWQPGAAPVRIDGEYYAVDGVPAGPVPAHPIEIWTGAQGPKALALTGRISDGWAAPIPSYLPYEKWADGNRIIDEAAREAGRDPATLRRIAHIVGTVSDAPGDEPELVGAAPVRGSAERWAALIVRLATEQPFTGFVFWPEEQSLDQVIRFARDVVPKARAAIG